MPAEDDVSIEEKRVYAASNGRTDAYVASEVGLVRVAISADNIGEFAIVARGLTRDVAVLEREDATDRIAVATDEDLLVADLEAAASGDLALRAVDVLGDAPVAVGVLDGAFLVADDGGAVALVPPDGDGAVALGAVVDPRSVDGPLVAAADGVHRVVGDARAVIAGDRDGRLRAVGLTDARDVAGAGVPLAATADGLYWLGNGWMDALDGPFDVVAADGTGRALAAAGADLYARRGDAWDADAWRVEDVPATGAVVALECGHGIALAVTGDGALCVDAGDGWRCQLLGVGGVGGVAVAGGEEKKGVYPR